MPSKRVTLNNQASCTIGSPRNQVAVAVHTAEYGMPVVVNLGGGIDTHGVVERLSLALRVVGCGAQLA